MANGQLTDFYLPSKVAYHVKIVIGSVLVTMFFNFIWRGSPFAEGFWITILLVFVQLEIFMAIALNVFPTSAIKTGKTYKSKIIIRLLLFYAAVLVIALVFLFLAILLSMLLSGIGFSETLNHFIARELKPFFVSWAIGMGIGSLIFFYLEWTKALKREQKLREEKLIFQYETLKNQVNPHFLFNSLNTLASLIFKDPGLSELFITKFSSIYRYILEHKDEEMVSLSDEISFIKNYFYLQKIRDDGKIDLQIHIDEPDSYRVLPISLQLLVENALKHNAATRESPLNINIYLEGDDFLVIENNLQKKMHMDPSSKIGLKNLGERISLVMNKSLIVEGNREKFVVKLPIMKVSDARSDH